MLPVLSPPPSHRASRCSAIATQVWREKALAGQTGHILRHTYRTIAQRVGVDQTDARLLMDHAVPGIEGVYVHERALFDRLLEAQERMTAAVFDLCGVDDGRAPAVRKA
jgi:integrase